MLGSHDLDRFVSVSSNSGSSSHLFDLVQRLNIFNLDTREPRGLQPPFEFNFLSIMSWCKCFVSRYGSEPPSSSTWVTWKSLFSHELCVPQLVQWRMTCYQPGWRSPLFLVPQLSSRMTRPARHAAILESRTRNSQVTKITIGSSRGQQPNSMGVFTNVVGLYWTMHSTGKSCGVVWDLQFCGDFTCWMQLTR
jgi:hypothetical protein